MAIKKKIDNLTSNIFLSISRISIVRTISNTLSSVFQIRAIKLPLNRLNGIRE